MNKVSFSLDYKDKRKKNFKDKIKNIKKKSMIRENTTRRMIN